MPNEAVERLPRLPQEPPADAVVVCWKFSVLSPVGSKFSLPQWGDAVMIAGGDHQAGWRPPLAIETARQLATQMAEAFLAVAAKADEYRVRVEVDAAR